VRGRRILGAISAAAVAVALAGCAPAVDTSAPLSELRLGYFPNFTHAPAIIMLENGYLADELDQTTITPVVFNAGPAAVEALFANAVDLSFIGPNPTITGFIQSNGEALRVVAGAASGGAGLVVREGLDSIDELEGATLATPQLGNTQDVALRFWLSENGFETTVEGGGDVNIVPQENATALQSFITGDLDGAWVPEPWLTRIVEEGGGHVLVDEASLWPDGQFVVTNLIAATSFVGDRPEVVRAVLAAELRAIEFIEQNPDEAKQIVNAHIEKVTGKGIDPAYLDAAWERVTFTIDPLASTLLASAEHAKAVGLLKSTDLDGLYSLDMLNSLLVAEGREPVRQS
jgi:NitT/TauT family transport system substrate-binding protein